MNDKFKISSLGLRIGYLYDLASPEDKESIEKILDNYKNEYPLILVGNKMKLAASPKEAKYFKTIFDNSKK